MKKMKKLTLLALILLLSLPCNSQTTTVLNKIPGLPTRMISDGTDIYYNLVDLGEVHKVDLTLDPLVPVVVVKGLSQPTSMALKGTVLYIVEFDGGKISRIDLSGSSIFAQDLLVDLEFPNGLVLDDDMLYFSESYKGTVAKIDITKEYPIPILVAEDLNFPTTMAVRGTELYISEALGNKISKISLSSTSQVATVVRAGLSRPIGIKMNGDTMYVAELLADRVSKFDVTDDTGGLEDVYDDFNFPSDIVFVENDLYFIESSFGVGHLSKLEDALIIVDVEDVLASRTIVFPNPTSAIINFKNLKESTTYKILGLDGSVICEGVVVSNGNIDLGFISAGMYIIQLGTGFSRIFVKK